MVSFQCEGCGDVLTKKKLDSHAGRCRNAQFSCLDCMKTFVGFDYRTHTSCISEDQKYQGHLYKDKRPAQKQQHNSQPRHAYVEDAPDTPDSSAPKRPQNQLSKVEAPPRAPTPPSAVPPDYIQKPSLFDYMVKDEDEKASESDSSSSSSHKSLSDNSSSSSSPSPSPSAASRQGRRSKGQPASSAGRHAFDEVGYTYGTGPVEPTLHRFNSGVDLNGKFGSTFATPAPSRNQTHDSQQSTTSQSDKKRKRVDADDARNINADYEDQRMLHSGLTGGLDRLLSNPEDDERLEPSPLSPKKRSKKSKEMENPARTGRTSSKTDGLHDSKSDRKADKRQSRATAIAEGVFNALTSKESRTKSDRSRKQQRQIEYHATRQPRSQNGQNPQNTALTKYRATGESHSEFFLSLVDKGHKSVKGQSIWGTLKTFHSGIRSQDMEQQDEAQEILELLKGRTPEERKLLKGLRLKINKRGEVVLFSRPQAEDET